MRSNFELKVIKFFNTSNLKITNNKMINIKLTQSLITRFFFPPHQILETSWKFKIYQILILSMIRIIQSLLNKMHPCKASASRNAISQVDFLILFSFKNLFKGCKEIMKMNSIL